MELNGPSEARRLERERARLSAAFELSMCEVVTDSQAMRTWRGGADDLLATICNCHAWDAEMGVMYMAHLRRTLDPSVGPSPWTFA